MKLTITKLVIPGLAELAPDLIRGDQSTHTWTPRWIAGQVRNDDSFHAAPLHAVGLPELITHSPAEYEALAIELASKPALLASFRQKLAGNLPTCALFDAKRFARNMESAYRQMDERHRSGLPPEHIHVV